MYALEADFEAFGVWGGTTTLEPRSMRRSPPQGERRLERGERPRRAENERGNSATFPGNRWGVFRFGCRVPNDALPDGMTPETETIPYGVTVTAFASSAPSQ
jgi:hypothetical protein